MSVRLRVLVFVTIWYWYTPMVTCASEWPGLRGPQQDGVAPDEQLAVTSEQPQVLWSRDLGQGYSSFAITDNRAFTQYQTTLGQYLICLDLLTGNTIWESRVGDPYELVGIYPGPRSTPAVHRGAVYFTTPDGEVGAADAQTGKLLWIKPLQKDLRGEGTEFGYAASPIIADDRLYLPIGGTGASIVALELPGGEVAWKSGSWPASYCSVLPISRSGHPLLVGYLQNELVVLDRDSGKELWKTQISGGYDEHSAMPIDFDSLLIVSAPFQAGSTAYRIEWQDAAQSQLRVEQVWHQPRFSLDVDSATRIGNVIYGFDLRDPQSKAHRPSRGEFRALDAETGRVLWSAADIGQSNAIAVRDELLLLNDAGVLIRAAVDKNRVREVWRLSVFEEEVTWTSPALASGIVLVRSHERAVAVRVGGTGSADPIISQPTTTWRSWIPRFHGLSAMLLQGEREHPFMRPSLGELRAWYLQSLAVLSLPLLRYLRQRRGTDDDPCRGLQWSLWLAAGCGIAATPLLNRLWPDQFAFTWPVTLFALFQSCVIAARGVALSPDDQRIRRASRRLGVAMILIYLAYFLLLRQASLPHEWVFLVLPVPAAPLAIWTGFLAPRKHWKCLMAVLILLTFSCGFWGATLAPHVFGWLTAR